MTLRQIIILAAIGFGFWLLWYGMNYSRGDVDQELVTAARGNKGLVRRMLQQARAKNPGQSERWYKEKVLYDLNRDYGVIKGRSARPKIDKRELRENLYLFGWALFVVNSLISLFERVLKR